MILKILRESVGRLIALISFLTSGKKLERSEELQKQVDEDCEKLSLYQFSACPFCIKVRRKIYQLNLPIEYRDAQNNQEFRTELKEKGGKTTVPCLRIEQDGKVKWMYESSDIISYLEEMFSANND